MIAGKLITLEGTEGAGKSTVLHLIKDYLTKHNVKVLMTREPGGTPLAETIRQVFLATHSEEALLAETELLLMFACRHQHIVHCIQPALAVGTWVVSDRYIDASYAYQGGGRAIAKKYLEFLDQWIVEDCYPHLTFLLDIPVDIGLLRIKNRLSECDRIEQEKRAFFLRVREAYLRRALDAPHRIKMIDASQSITNVEQQLYTQLDQFLQHNS
jgi:dTMP kinase